MSALASPGKTLGMGMFLRLLLKNINRKKKFLAPDGNLKHSKLDIFCQNYGILLIIRAFVADLGYSVLSLTQCLKECGSLRSLCSFWMLSRYVCKLSKVLISRVTGTRFTCLWWNCRQSLISLNLPCILHSLTLWKMSHLLTQPDLVLFTVNQTFSSMFNERGTRHLKQKETVEWLSTTVCWGKKGFLFW